MRRFRVTGRVQGVGFRWWSRNTGQRLGLRGTVRNCPDGSVELVVDGPEEAVRDFADELRRGPGSADVQNLEASTPPPGTRVPDAFEIVR